MCTGTRLYNGLGKGTKFTRAKAEGRQITLQKELGKKR